MVNPMVSLRANPMVSLARRRTLLVAAVLASLTAVLSCKTTPAEPEGGTEGQGTTEVAVTTTEKTTTEPAATADSAEIAALQKYLDVAYEKIDQGLISEGILNYVTILSELSRSKAPSDDAKEFGKTAEEELTRLGSGLSLSAAGEWMDADKNQISASTLDVGTPKGLNPSVVLTYSYSGARSMVTDAPVIFEFVEGSGMLVTPVTTNDYGQANTTVTSLDNPKTENIIRATVSYRVKGYSYTFKGASRDFAYVPPVRKATILVLERAAWKEGEEEKSYISTEPVILDRAYNVLKGVEFQYTPYNGNLLGDDYMKVFGGDNPAIRALGLEEGVSYLIMILSDTYYVRQVELNGKKYEIYKTKANGTTRVIRAADGAILYSGTVQSVDGQGNTPEKAIIDGFRNTADKMAERLQADLPQISKSLLGE